MQHIITENNIKEKIFYLLYYFLGKLLKNWESDSKIKLKTCFYVNDKYEKFWMNECENGENKKNE